MNGTRKSDDPERSGRYIEELVPTYMWHCMVAFMFGIFSPYLIGLILAGVGMVFASRAERLRVQGRLSKALGASKSARMWMLFSVGFTVIPMAGRILPRWMGLS